ncbi:Stomatin-like protein 2 [Hordeum vulgare]|nr:Stomatin-like protein 2 [Hordeum vulgare]
MLARSAVPGHLLRSAAVTASPAVATAALLQRRWYRGGVDPAPSFYDPPPTPANLGLSIVPEKKEFVLERFGKYLLPCSWRMVTCSSGGYVSALYVLLLAPPLLTPVHLSVEERPSSVATICVPHLFIPCLSRASYSKPAELVINLSSAGAILPEPGACHQILNEFEDVLVNV